MESNTLAVARRIASAALVAFHLLAAPALLHAQARRPDSKPNAPPDRPHHRTRCQWRAAKRAMAPYVARAQASFPKARQRYVAALPAGYEFLITTRLKDRTGREEQIFVAVDSSKGNFLFGRIASDITLVQLGVDRDDAIAVSDKAVIDWTISRPDGTEEGNIVGVFLDTYRPPARCVDPPPAG